MKRKVLVLTAVALLIFGVVWAWGLRAHEPDRENMSGELSNMSAIRIFPSDPLRIIAGASGKIVLREPDQESWRVVLFLKGTGLQINAFAFDPQNAQRVYAATSDGLWMSAHAGKDWKRVFKGANQRQNDCTAVAISSQCAFLGASQGVLKSLDGGRTWHRESGELARARVIAIVLNGSQREAILATVNAIYIFSMQRHAWEKRFSLPWSQEACLEDDEEGGPQDTESNGRRFTSLAVDPFVANRIVAGTTEGLVESIDGGLTWREMTDDGLLDRHITAVLFGRSSIVYCAAGRNLYQRVGDRWQEVPLNSAGARITALSLGKHAEVYVATDKGLFHPVLQQPVLSAPHSIVSEYLTNEPSIQKVQQAAIRYAEVEPEKIKLWRKLAASRAVLPKVSASLGRDTTDLWHWESGSTTKANDDVLVRGRDNLDWSVSISWDLGDLVWVDAQTSIDTRSKLMVELRESILDEVTKIYFERIRLKAEMDNCVIEDRKKVFEKELKLSELTASLDALTGQFFSSALGKK